MRRPAARFKGRYQRNRGSQPNQRFRCLSTRFLDPLECVEQATARAYYL
jgi:hypothetical protein